VYMTLFCKFLFNLFLFCPTDGFMHYSKTRCVFNSTELTDIEYIRSSYYNKLEYLRFSSSLGKFVGFTEFGVKNAEYFNNDPAVLSAERAQKEVYCLPNTEIWYRNVLSKSGECSWRHFHVPAHPRKLLCDKNKLDFDSHTAVVHLGEHGCTLGPNWVWSTSPSWNQH
uniref:MHC class II beta chain N-terminal domain-containing protein n=1 Tax=Acanthochromis polyacanthus TaxID=80966 RepID=A0A3Q1FC90_9TELE